MVIAVIVLFDILGYKSLRVEPARIYLFAVDNTLCLFEADTVSICKRGDARQRDLIAVSAAFSAANR